MELETKIFTDKSGIETEKPFNKVDALIVLNAGFENTKGGLKTTFETKMRLLAAAHLYCLGLTDKIILCGGRLYAEDLPADSQVMKEFLLASKFQIPESAIITEEKSHNTIDNFKFVKEILEKHPEIQTVGVLSHWHHLFCGGRTAAKNLNLKPEFFSVEKVLKTRHCRFDHDHYASLIKRHYTSWLTKPGSQDFWSGLFMTAEDMSRLLILTFDKDGKLLSWLAKHNITAGKIKGKLL